MFPSQTKGNISISCACANACLSLFAEESRGCGVLEMQIAQKVCRARGPRDKNDHFALSEVNSCLPINSDFAISEVAISWEKLLRCKRHYIISEFAISNKFLVTRRILVDIVSQTVPPWKHPPWDTLNRENVPRETISPLLQSPGERYEQLKCPPGRPPEGSHLHCRRPPLEDVSLPQPQPPQKSL